jgi:hypothetical protein
MSFSDRMMEILDQGIAASKEFAAKAGAKTRDLGEKGVLLIDIKRLEFQVSRLVNNLGRETYMALVERNQDSVEKNTPAIASILAEIAKVREELEKKETEFKAKH